MCNRAILMCDRENSDCPNFHVGKFGLSEFPCWEIRIVRISLFVEKRELQFKQSDGDTSIFLTGEIANASCDGDRSSWAF
jgi:hypothetical protein